MTKRQLIEEITHLNPTAKPAFLAAFGDEDLAEYLQHLQWVDQPPNTWGTPQRARSPALQAADATASRADTEPPAAADWPADDDQADQTPAPVAKDSSKEEAPVWLF